MIALLLFACGPRSEPDLTSAEAALEAWERGKARLEADDPAGARQAFAEARAAREGPVLAAWEGAAAARAGDLEGALAAYREALAADPGFATARYRYGVLLAQAGQVPEAAAELRRAVEEGAASTLSLLEDPDLAPHLAHPAFDFVPEHPLTAAVDPVPPTAFWGSEVEVVARLVGLVRPPYRVVSAPVAGPVRLLSVVQEDVSTSQGPGLAVRIRLEVTGAGRVEVGPLTLEAGRFQATTDQVSVDAAAPPGKEQAPPGEVRIRLPDEVFAQVPPPSAAWVDGDLVVAARVPDRVALEPQPKRSPSTSFERRTADGAILHASVWAGPLPPTKVRIEARETGEVLFDGPPAG